MKTKERKMMRRRWILLGILLAAVVAVGSFAMGETPERPVSAGERGAPFAANGSAEAGAFTLTATEDPVINQDYYYDTGNKVLTILSSKEMTIANTNPGETDDRIKIQLNSAAQAAGAHLTLAGVNIVTQAAYPGPALEIEEDATFDVNITLADDIANTLDASSSDDAAGLQKVNDYSATLVGKLTIGGTGSLTAKGGSSAAGIGSGEMKKAGSNIEITGGTVNATGGQYGAGIGGGNSGSNITISGGTVTATGGYHGAGIGGGDQGRGSNITITGGTVTATGQGGGAGIGSGNGEDESNITISGGIVTATGGNDGGAGIGGGRRGGSGSNITISGGTVTATGGYYGAGIGSGSGGTGNNNTLEGNAVVLASSGAAIVDAMEGFTYTKGIAFITNDVPSSSNKYAGTVYGEVATADLEGGNLTFPENTESLTISENGALSVSSGQTLTVPDGVTVKNEGTLNIGGSSYGTITCEGTGQVTTLLKYDVNGGLWVEPSSKDCVYLNSTAGDKTYGDLPTPIWAGYNFTGWYDNATGGNEITKDTVITDVNLHTIYAHWEEFPCPFTVTGGTKDTDWSYENGVLAIKTTQVTGIANNDPATPTDVSIAIDYLGGSETTLNLTLNGVNIKSILGSALQIADNAAYNVNLTLADGTTNILDADASLLPGAAGLQKGNDSSATSVGKLTIGGTGSLTAKGRTFGAGIGGGYDESSIGKDGTDITISGGTVTVQGGYNAAGIGGGNGGSGNDITISGGTVTATGGANGGAGIGGARGGSNITISGGTVEATGGSEASGIGSGYDGGTGKDGTDITITGGTVIANGGEMGAGIGGGYQGRGSGITIEGGTVTATGSYGGAGIGGGLGGNGEKIQITGGTVTAQGGAAGTIEGVTVTEGAGIGGGGGVPDSGIPAGAGKDNSLDGDAVVLSTSGGEDKEALEGFNVGLTRGIAFTRQSATATWPQGEMYGDSVTVRTDAAFPADLTVANDQTLTVNDNTVLILSEGATLQNEGRLVNYGILHNMRGTILSKGTGITTNVGELESEGTITCEESGEVRIRVSYLDEESNLEDRDILYQNASGVQPYTGEDLPRLEKGETVFLGWYFDQGRTSEAKVGENVRLNEHLLFAKWGARPAPDPTPDPSPGPSVDSDSDGSHSAKTGDPFAGGMALVLLGAASVVGIALKKRK